MWTSYSDDAEWCLLLARTDHDVAKHRGISAFALPMRQPGIGQRPLRMINGVTKEFGEVQFDGASVQMSQEVGTDGDAVLQRAIDLATVLQASEAVGAADFLFNETVDYLRVRMQFGRTIASFQAIKHRLADLLTSLEGMRAATHYAALALNDNLDDFKAAVSTAGAYVGDEFARICGESLQLHGGIGFTWEHDVHLFLRRAITSRELYGGPCWHRERLCAIAEVA